MSEQKKTFTYLDSKQVEHTISFEENDFELTQQGKKIFDQKIQTKPTTFFKDAMKRFTKNKSSVAGAYILGTIVLLAIVLPLVLPSDISTGHASEAKLEPKLFDAGTGFWDGCRDYNHVALETDWEHYDETGVVRGWPASFEHRAVMGGEQGVKIDSEMSYISAVNPYASLGYARVNVLPGNDAELRSWNGHTFDVTNDRTYSITIKTVDPRKNSDWNYGEITATYSAYFNWLDQTDGTLYSYPLGTNVEGVGEHTFNFAMAELSALDPDVGRITASTQKPYLSVVFAPHESKTNNLVIEKIAFSSSMAGEKESLDALSLLDANASLSIPPKKEDGTPNENYWTAISTKLNLYHARFFYCSFRYDTYELAFGDRQDKVSIDAMKGWAERGWLTADFDLVNDLKNVPASKRKEVANQFVESVALTEEGKGHCPMHLDEEHPIKANVLSAGKVVAVEIECTITKWKEYYPDRNSCPRYLFGTDAAGRDMLKLTFSGLRTSLLLGVITAAITFAFGLVWGAIAGYFGGWVDIIMERLTDLLGGVPWIVVMTLAIVQFGSSFGVFVMALCLTGWIGTASLTRTQFYRFKNREYILAARTLGASDFRLIFRHILPNAVGTIVTSSVFMITSVIYSEATIAYLNLGLTGMDSFGVTLANNQQFITTYPHLILFPSFIMLLMMISFNLFGNGLRDAFNPSLKGGE